MIFPSKLSIQALVLAAGFCAVSDCQAVIGDIWANNGTIKVAGGFCMNRWEICGGKTQEVFSADSKWIADTMTASILDTCIAQGKSGAAADCADVSTRCGTYKAIAADVYGRVRVDTDVLLCDILLACYSYILI
ncbi:hypothetical protein F4774DRAFT_257823 [Daldinia eschscholtzii]|nr:hypothetical protein F4774DRAFT_257823 [Daldinia eschscholtzii]